MYIIIALLLSYVALATIATLVNMSDYKSYKPTYESLINGEYVFYLCSNTESMGTIYFFLPKGKQLLSDSDETQRIVFLLNKFEKPNSIILLGRKHISRRFILTIDPYTMYWNYKFWNWFNKNKSNFVSEK